MTVRLGIVMGIAAMVPVTLACHLGGREMAPAPPQVLRTDPRSPIEVDPLLRVTLSPMDGGADASSPAAAPPARRPPPDASIAPMAPGHDGMGGMR